MAKTAILARLARLARLTLIGGAFVFVFCGCKGSSDAEWTGRELKPVEASVGGVAFTISLPEGIKKSDAQSGEASIVWEAEVGKAAAPAFAVSKVSLPPATLKDAIARSGGGEVPIVRQETVDDGFIVARRSSDNALVKVDVYRPVGAEALWCNGMQVKSGGLSKPEAAGAMLEKVCLSMLPKAGDPGAAKRPPPPFIAPEMKDFMAGFGSKAQVAESLKKYGAPDLQTKDMESYDLADPKVTKAELHGAKTCYSLEARAGAATRVYLVCWDEGKIAVIDDMGMK